MAKSLEARILRLENCRIDVLDLYLETLSYDEVRRLQDMVEAQLAATPGTRDPVGAKRLTQGEQLRLRDAIRGVIEGWREEVKAV